ncbi:hypothetical protein GCM10009733_059650 [Nonomuraea maheshkhaliensis]|uniref:DUF3592 domain-containing protein n=1 Tax=Nonomuraea maheshkhaliensis TaxID=419590 RepID=A0ABN2FMY2_9ACTN
MNTWATLLIAAAAAFALGRFGQAAREAHGKFVTYRAVWSPVHDLDQEPRPVHGSVRERGPGDRAPGPLVMIRIERSFSQDPAVYGQGEGLDDASHLYPY